MSHDLPPTAQLRFVPASTPADCLALADRLQEPAIYEAALCLGYAPSREVLAELLASGNLEVWQAVPHDGEAPVALAIDSHLVGDHELYAYPLGPVDPDVCVEILQVLARRVFTGPQPPRAVFTAWPLPVPAKLRQAIEQVGWEPIASDTDRGFKRSFWLENVIYALYAEDDEASDPAEGGKAGGP